MPLRSCLALILFVALAALCALPGFSGEEELCKTNGERVPGPLSFSNGTWTAGGAKVLSSETLVVQFTHYPPPERVPSGIFLRGGTLLVGALDTVIGDKVTFNSRSLSSALELKREDFGGAFFPLPTGSRENFPALGRYGTMVTTLAGDSDEEKMPATFGGARIYPGRRDRATYANLDGLDGRLLRMGNTSAIIELPTGKTSSPSRDVVRLIECKTAPLAQSGAKDVFVRLKAGDLLRGTLVSLDDKNLTIATAYAGQLKLPRETLAELFPAGGKDASVQWLSQVKPSKVEFTPLFDSDFPVRMNLSVESRMMRLGGLICDRGVGVHARSELTYAFEAKAGRHFVAFVGIDDETEGRGVAEAKVLVNGKVVFQSGPLKGGQPPKPVKVDLTAGNELKLIVEYGSDNDDSGDHVDWGWAAIVN